MGISPPSPEVIWDLHQTRCTLNAAYKLNGNSAPISKLETRHFLRWAMRRQMAQRVMQQGFVILADLVPIQCQALQFCLPHT